MLEFFVLFVLNLYHAIGENRIISIEPRFISNNGVVTVTYTSEMPSLKDYVAAYSPADANINYTSPVKFGSCASDSSYLVN